MKSRKLYLFGAVAAAALTVAGVHAQDGPMPVPGTSDASGVSSGTYAADPLHTMVGWRINHLGFNDYFGIFGDVTGTLTLDRANLAASKVDVTIPVASVTVASPGLRDHLMRAGQDGAKPDFFGPSPAPARFVSTSVTPGVQGDDATIHGNLTLNGVTRPVTIAAQFTGAGLNPMSGKETVGFEGRAAIHRGDFGVSFGIPIVADEVVLDITAAFEKQ